MIPDPPVPFLKQLSFAGRLWRGSITIAASGGWEIREQFDARILQHVFLSDWHRVERARHGLSLKAASLRATGWAEARGIARASGGKK